MSERVKICDASKVITYRLYDVIIREGEPGRTFYILVSGRVDVSKQATGVVAQLKPGDSFGEIALMHGQTTRSATICAATETVAKQSVRNRAHRRAREAARGKGATEIRSPSRRRRSRRQCARSE